MDQHQTVPVKTNVNGTAQQQLHTIVVSRILVWRELLIVVQQANHIVQRLILVQHHVHRVEPLLRANSKQVLISHIFHVLLSTVILISVTRFHQVVQHQ